MKKCFLLYALLGFCLTVYSQEDGPVFTNGSTVYVFGDNVNMRNSPSTDGGLVGKLRIGTPVKIIHRSTERYVNSKGVDIWWYMIEFEKDGNTQKGYIWGGLLALAQYTWTAADGKAQQIMVGMESYEEPGMYGGGYTLQAKWVSGTEIRSSCSFHEPYTLRDASAIMLTALPSTGLQDIDYIFLMQGGGYAETHTKQVLYLTRRELYAFYATDSLFMPGHPMGKPGYLVDASYSYREKPPRLVHTVELTWDGLGFKSGTRAVFRDPLPVYLLPDTNAAVVASLHLGDSVTVYLDGGNDKLSKTMTVNKATMNWNHISFFRNNERTEGYIWEGYFTHAGKRCITPDNRQLAIWCGMKKKISDYNYILDTKIQLDGSLYPVIPLSFASCGIEWGPYLFPDIELVQKKVAGFTYAMLVSNNINCEGSDFEDKIYLFFDGAKWHSLALPTGDINQKYELCFPEDEKGEAGKLVVYKTSGWENPVTTLYKKYTWDGTSFK